jgi:hypothetical protein
VKPELGKTNYSVAAHCPTCQAVTSFEQKQLVAVQGVHEYEGKAFQRVLYVLTQCSRCQRGGFAVVPDNGNLQTAVVESFFPISVDAFPLPAAVPPDIVAEFREAELCAAFKAKQQLRPSFVPFWKKLSRPTAIPRATIQPSKTYKSELMQRRQTVL